MIFIAVKEKKVIAIHELEWQCRRNAKGLSKPAYWAWLATVTSGDPPVSDFSGEDYEIVETDAPLSYQDKDSNGNDITVFFNESGYIVSDLEGTHYHLKWDGSKIVKDDEALTAYQTAEKWKNIREDRNRRLAETDYLALKDNTLSTAMKEYRTKLRSVPQDNSDPDNITWPLKPT